MIGFTLYLIYEYQTHRLSPLNSMLLAFGG